MLHVSVCVCVRALIALLTKHAKRMRHIVICSLSGSTTRLPLDDFNEILYVGFLFENLCRKFEFY